MLEVVRENLSLESLDVYYPEALSILCPADNAAVLGVLDKLARVNTYGKNLEGFEQESWDLVLFGSYFFWN